MAGSEENIRKIVREVLLAKPYGSNVASFKDVPGLFASYIKDDDDIGRWMIHEHNREEGTTHYTLVGWLWEKADGDVKSEKLVWIPAEKTFMTSDTKSYPNFGDNIHNALRYVWLQRQKQKTQKEIEEDTQGGYGVGEESPVRADTGSFKADLRNWGPIENIKESKEYKEGDIIRLKGTDYFAELQGLGWNIFEKGHKERIGVFFYEIDDLRFYDANINVQKTEWSSWDFVENFPFDINRALKYVYLKRQEPKS